MELYPTMAPLKVLSSESSPSHELSPTSENGSSLVSPFAYSLCAPPRTTSLIHDRCSPSWRKTEPTTYRHTENEGDASANYDSGHISPADEVEEALEYFKPQSLPSQLCSRFSLNELNYCADMLANYARRQQRRVRAVTLRQHVVLSTNISPPVTRIAAPITPPVNYRRHGRSMPEHSELETGEQIANGYRNGQSLANGMATPTTRLPSKASNPIVTKQNSSKDYASRSTASSQGGGSTFTNESPRPRGQLLKRRSSASCSDLGALEIRTVPRPRSSEPTSSNARTPSTSLSSTRSHSTSVSLCERCWSNLRSTLASPIHFEVGANRSSGLVDFTATNGLDNKEFGSIVLKFAAYGEVVAARRSQRRRVQERARAAAAMACDTDDEEEDGTIVIEDDDLPPSAYDDCMKNVASTSNTTSAVPITSPIVDPWNPLGDERELAQMRELMRRNVYVPSALLTEVPTGDEQRPFVINRRSGNAVALPSRVAYAPVPSTERLKVIVVGKSGVGKTTVVFSHYYGGMTEKRSPQSYTATVGAAYFNLDLTVNGIPLYLQVWDTAGQERFRCMVPMYVRNASAAVIIYDITDRASFEESDRYIAEIKRTQSDGREPLLILVGNKCDLDHAREVAPGEGQAKASMISAVFFEVAATNTTMVTALLAHIAERIYGTDSELKSRLAANYRTKDKPQSGLRILKTGEKSFTSRCCIIN